MGFLFLILVIINSTTLMVQTTKIGQTIEFLTINDILLIDFVTNIENEIIVQAKQFQGGLNLEAQISSSGFVQGQRGNIKIAIKRKLTRINELTLDVARKIENIEKKVKQGLYVAKSNDSKDVIGEMIKQIMIIKEEYKNYSDEINLTLLAISDEDSSYIKGAAKRVKIQEEKLFNRLGIFNNHVSQLTGKAITQLKKDKRRVRNFQWGAIIVSLFVVIGYSTFILNSINYPLQKIIHEAEKVNNGKEVNPFDMDLSGEMGIVIEAFNKLNQRISRSYDVVDGLVKARTKELNEKIDTQINEFDKLNYDLEEEVDKRKAILDEVASLNDYIVQRDMQVLDLKKRIKELERGANS